MPARSEKTLQLDEMLCFAVHSTGFAFNQIYRQPLKKLGLTYPQYLVMIALWNEDGVAVSRIGDQLALDTGTMTPMLKRLETMGLLTRRRSSTDERRVMITLTDRGRALRQKASDVMLCVVRSVGMPPEKMNRLVRDIRGLRNTLRAASSQARSAPRRKVG